MVMYRETVWLAEFGIQFPVYIHKGWSKYVNNSYSTSLLLHMDMRPSSMEFFFTEILCLYVCLTVLYVKFDKQDFLFGDVFIV